MSLCSLFPSSGIHSIFPCSLTNRIPSHTGPTLIKLSLAFMWHFQGLQNLKGASLLDLSSRLIFVVISIDWILIKKRVPPAFGDHKRSHLVKPRFISFEAIWTRRPRKRPAYPEYPDRFFVQKSSYKKKYLECNEIELGQGQNHTKKDSSKSKTPISCQKLCYNVQKRVLIAPQTRKNCASFFPFWWGW